MPTITKVKLNLGRDRWLFQLARRRKSPASKGDMDSSTPAVTMTSFQAAMEVRGDKQCCAGLSVSQNFKRNELIHPAYSGSIVQHCFRLLCLQMSAKNCQILQSFLFCKAKEVVARGKPPSTTPLWPAPIASDLARAKQLEQSYQLQQHGDTQSLRHPVLGHKTCPMEH